MESISDHHHSRLAEQAASPQKTDDLFRLSNIGRSDEFHVARQESLLLLLNSLINRGIFKIGAEIVDFAFSASAEPLASSFTTTDSVLDENGISETIFAAECVQSIVGFLKRLAVGVLTCRDVCVPLYVDLGTAQLQ